MRFLKYVGVQLVAYGVDMGSFLLIMLVFPAHPLLANLMGKILAGIFAFLVHRNFTFALRSEEKEHLQAFKYAALLGLNLPLSSAVMAAVMLVVSPAVIAKFIADVICVALTYWLSKTYVFTARRNPDSGKPAGSGRRA